MMRFLSHHKRYIIISIAGIFILRGASRQVGTSEQILQPISTTPTSLNISTDLDTITGVLLNGPSGNNWTQRSHLMGSNNDYIKGRIYDITYKPAKQWMKTKSKTTTINLIVEQDKYQQYADDFGNLQKEFANYHNITLLSDRTLNINNMHAKTFVGEKRRVIQTANLNGTSFNDNREHFFLSTNEIIRKNLLDLFALDQKTIVDKKTYKDEYLTLTQSFSPNLLVCPLDCRQKLESFISSARKSIRISAQYITDERIIALLRKQSDLDIRILTNDMTNNDEIVRYFGKKVVKFESAKQYNHDKMVIIDNEKIFIGSTNLSQNALDNNREIGIILTDQQFIDQQKKLFN